MRVLTLTLLAFTLLAAGDCLAETNSTTTQYGPVNSTQNYYGPSNITINSYGNSNMTVNNYGTGHTTVNDSVASRTTVNSPNSGYSQDIQNRLQWWHARGY
jgi:hypothetical protein